MEPLINPPQHQHQHPHQSKLIFSKFCSKLRWCEDVKPPWLEWAGRSLPKKILPNQKIIWYYFEIVHIFAIFGLHLLSRKFRPLGIFDNWRKQCLSSWVPCAPQKGPMRTKNPLFLLSKYFYPNISIQIFLYNFWKREASNGVCLLQMIPICVRFSGQPPTSHPYLLSFTFVSGQPPTSHLLPFTFYLFFWSAYHFSPFTFYLLSFTFYLFFWSATHFSPVAFTRALPPLRRMMPLSGTGWASIWERQMVRRNIFSQALATTLRLWWWSWSWCWWWWWCWS